MSNALVPLQDMQQMATAFAASGFFGVKNPEQALTLMLVAQAEQQHPATIAQDYDIIQGRPARKTHSVLARFQSTGGTVEWLELTDQVAKARFSHPSGGSIVMRWDMSMAQAAGLSHRDNWKKYPRAMLRSRCIAEAIRAIYPAAIGGLLVVEEAQDLPPVEEKDVTPGHSEDQIIEAVDKINACKDLGELLMVWSPIYKEFGANKRLTDAKDAMKIKLSEQATANPTDEVQAAAEQIASDAAQDPIDGSCVDVTGDEQ